MIFIGKRCSKIKCVGRKLRVGMIDLNTYNLYVAKYYYITQPKQRINLSADEGGAVGIVDHG